MSASRRSSSTQKEASLTPAPGPPKAAEDVGQSLALAFVLMVFVGLGNKIFQKLQTLPMHNYANSLNLMTTFFYIPVSFAYVLPMIKWGTWITPEQRAVPTKDFAVMGFLDCLAGIMQIFAATYLDGTLLILLSQSAIPISMAISRSLLKTKYNKTQYTGATLVVLRLPLCINNRQGFRVDWLVQQSLAPTTADVSLRLASAAQAR
jgi:hypothetical protein